jgi:hypothetical protein
MNDSLLQSVTASAEQPVHDVRAVHDAVGLRFDGVGHGKGAWIVIKIIPAAYARLSSGSAPPNTGVRNTIGDTVTALLSRGLGVTGWVLPRRVGRLPVRGRTAA